MKRIDPYVAFCALFLLLGAGLRLVGLTRGSSDFVLPEQAQLGNTVAFYSFHPDEEMVIRAALQPVDLLHPPMTVYGVLPIYALHGVLLLTAALLGWGSLSIDSPESACRVYVVARLLAALCSCATLALVWALGRRYFGRPAASLGLALAACAPGAIQQAHFYIVDGAFLLLSTAAVYATLRALETQRKRWYLAAGLAIGGATAVRLNGALLGVVLLVGHLASGWQPDLRGACRGVGRRLLRVELWLAAGAAVLVVVGVEPFMVLHPAMLWREDSAGDFALAVKVVRGELLQPWTLADVHAVPYLDHWFQLWPLAVGWPLTLVFLMGVGHVLWRRRSLPVLLMLLWCACCFLLIGSMQAKAVRYVVPLLPFLSLFAADLGAAAWMSRGPALRTWAARIAVAATVLYTVLYGLAFARIYRVEDSRVTAGRWIAERVAKGSRIGLEGGGFSLRRVVSSTAQKQARLDIPRLFYVGPYMTCQVQLDFLREQALGLDYLAVVDAGYYAQYTAVPELFPAVAGFYERLIAGELGFDRVQRFKVHPRIAGWEFVDDGAEPSFLGYDHPAVLVFARRNPQGVEDGFARWRTEMEADPHCADRLLGQVAELLRSGDAERAREAAQRVVAGYPMVILAHILEAEAQRRLGDTTAELAARRRFQPENAQGLTAHVVNANMIHFIPGAAALSLAHLELPDLALEVLSGGVGKAAAYSPRAAEEMAQSYVRVAQYFEGTDRPELAEEVLVLSTRVYGLKEAYNSLAALAYRKGEALKAVEWWGKSLLADANQGNVFGFVGMVKADTGEYDQALQHLERAVQLAPSLASELEPWLAEARRNTAR